MKRLTLVHQNAYHELLQRHLGAFSPLIKGSIILVTKGSGSYWVERKRAGDKIIETSIGPDDEKTRDMVSVAKQQKDYLDELSKGNYALVSSLKTINVLCPTVKVGRIIDSVAKTGFFERGGVLGGTQAFRHYPLMLGYHPSDVASVQTIDLDLMADKGLSLMGDKSLTKMLSDSGISLRTVFGVTDDVAPKHIAENEVEIEMLAPVARGGDIAHYHKGLRERVQALKFLEFCLKDPVKTVSLYRGGTLISVPSPQRYALHKLIVSQLRKGSFSSKSNKDLAQADWLIRVLAQDEPYELIEAWKDLRGRGAKWRQLADAALTRIPQSREAVYDLSQDHHLENEQSKWESPDAERS